MLENLEPNTLLIDYYDRTVGTPMEQPFYELVLYKDENPEYLRLEEYTEGGTKNEYVRTYKVPLDAYTKIIDVILNEKMDTWNQKKNLIGIVGMAYVCKFYYNGELVRVSSDHMPSDGTKSFGEVAYALRQYLQKDQLLHEDYLHPIEVREPEPVIHNYEELSQFEKQLPITLDNYEEYGHITSGMGPKVDEYGMPVGSVISYVSFYWNKGYYPAADFEVSATYKKNDDNQNDTASANAKNTWIMDPFDHSIYTHLKEYEAAFGIENIVVTDIKGNAFYFELPEEYLHEDEDGQYFYYTDNTIRYYLDGSSRVDEAALYYPAATAEWTLDYLKNRK